MNGVVNLSILDGWFDEAYEGSGGWAIGDREPYSEDQDNMHAAIRAAVAAIGLGYLAAAEGDLEGVIGWHARAMENARASADAPVIAEALGGLADLALTGAAGLTASPLRITSPPHRNREDARGQGALHQLQTACTT